LTFILIIEQIVLSKLIIGCGYVGLRLAMHWSGLGEEVWVTTRSEDRAAEFSKLGLKPIVMDVTNIGADELPNAETIVFAVGFDRTGPHQIHDVYVDGLQNVLQRCPTNLKRFIYLSSTGVYGQIDGDWVDELSPCNPIRDGGKACLAAEQLLQASDSFSAKTIILRLAGIYGPDRLPQAAALMRGEPLRVAADGHLNLIHVDDIVRVVAKCEKIELPLTLCVSDGSPVVRADFYDCLAKLLETPPPVFAQPEQGSARADRARGSKRIRNARLIELLQPKFAFPSYREGLADIVRQM